MVLPPHPTSPPWPSAVVVLWHVACEGPYCLDSRTQISSHVAEEKELWLIRAGAASFWKPHTSRLSDGMSSWPRDLPGRACQPWGNEAWPSHRKGQWVFENVGTVDIQSSSRRSIFSEHFSIIYRQKRTGVYKLTSFHYRHQSSLETSNISSPRILFPLKFICQPRRDSGCLGSCS